jgi:tRNA(Ile2) C34 agmatinyltransferase TiaS
LGVRAARRPPHEALIEALSDFIERGRIVNGQMIARARKTASMRSIGSSTGYRCRECTHRKRPRDAGRRIDEAL